MRTATEHTFTAPDGTSLFYRAWLPPQKAKQAVLLFHRGHEHSGRMQLVVDGLQMENVAFFAWDQRGCGRSPGQRGHARSMAQIAEDMQAFYAHVQREHQPEHIAAVAHSVAAVAAGIWAVDYAPRLSGLVLATPALKVKLYVPFARRALPYLKMPEVQSYVKGWALTHDSEQARLYDNDPLISKQIATHLLLDLYKTAQRLQKTAGNLEIPTQVLAARADLVVKNLPIRRLFRALPSPYKEIHVYKDFFHAVFHEKDRHLVFKDVRSFLFKTFDLPQYHHHHIASHERYVWAKAGLPHLSPKNWAFKLTKFALKTVGRLSQGLRIGLKHGFSSGPMLDYVYENQPRGVTALGRFIDRHYLDSVGWRRIRQRREHIQQLFNSVTLQPARCADLAGGPGRYWLEVLASRPDAPLQVTVRDQDQKALEQGRNLAYQQGEKRITYVHGDAFSAESVAALGPLDVAVVSGLYELFPDNAPLRSSLAGLAKAVKPGGYLIYTNQPYHPQLEVIAETLTHADGSRWVMRCRSTAEMDELVREAGFRKERMLIDDDGIFSVSLAVRV